MGFRRPAARGAALLAAVIALGLAGPAPSVAAGTDVVTITSAPASFTVGGAAGVYTMSITRREPECVRLRGMTWVTLSGLAYGDFRVEVERYGKWEEAPISHSHDYLFRAEDNWGEVEFLCPGQSRVMRHRITFLAGAPTGQATIDGIVSALGGDVMGRDQVIRPVLAGRAAAAPPAPRTSPAIRRTAAPATARAPSATAPPPGTPAADPAAAIGALGGTGSTGEATGSGPVGPDLGATTGGSWSGTTSWVLTGGVGAGSLAGLGIGAFLLLRRRRAGG